MVQHMSLATHERDPAQSLVTLVSSEGSAAHFHARSLLVIDNATAARNSADAIHYLTMLHGRHPGVVDHAAARSEPLLPFAASFAIERDLLARLVVAVGPIPSTPGQAETEASVVAQHHALDMLAQSDRRGCSGGAALALLLDWHAVRRVLAAAARRFGVEAQPPALPGAAQIARLAADIADTAGAERAMLFGAQQIANQHRGLWDLLDARAKARGSF